MGKKDSEMESSVFDFDQDSENYVWVVDFDDKALRLFYKKFMELESDPKISVIPIYIASYGGETDVLSAMRDIIKSASKPVATIALGKAMSCGVALLAAGTKGLRFASPNTDIMIHEVSAGTYGKTTEMQATMNDIERTNRRFMANFAKDTGHTVKEIMGEIAKRKNADWYLNAEEAKAFGIVDHIEVPRVSTEPSSVTLAVLPRAPSEVKVSMEEDAAPSKPAKGRQKRHGQ